MRKFAVSLIAASCLMVAPQAAAQQVYSDTRFHEEPAMLEPFAPPSEFSSANGGPPIPLAEDELELDPLDSGEMLAEDPPIDPGDPYESFFRSDRCYGSLCET